MMKRYPILALSFLRRCPAIFGAGLFLLSALPTHPTDEAQDVAPQIDAGMIRISDFLIDKYEYPNLQGELPRVDVTWSEAQSLCQATGKRLCSEYEWELACRGPEGQLYGYGSEFESGRCHTPNKVDDEWKRGPDKVPSGFFPDCQSSLGVNDMIGNVWEWTDGLYSAAENWHVVRGGSWFHSVNLARADTRYGRFLDPDFKLDLIGLRCCRSAADAAGGGTGSSAGGGTAVPSPTTGADASFRKSPAPEAGPLIAGHAPVRSE